MLNCNTKLLISSPIVPVDVEFQYQVMAPVMDLVMGHWKIKSEVYFFIAGSLRENLQYLELKYSKT